MDKLVTEQAGRSPRRRAVVRRRSQRCVRSGRARRARIARAAICRFSWSLQSGERDASDIQGRRVATATRLSRCSCPMRSSSIGLPSFSAVVTAATAAHVTLGVLPIESSLVGPIAETHDLLYGSALSIVREATLPIRHCVLGLAGARVDGATHVLVASGRVRSVPRAPRRAGRAVRARRDDRRRCARGSRAGDPAPGRDRQHRGGGRLRPRRASPTTSATARRVHAVRRARAVHPARRRRRLADGSVVRHRPPARRAVPRARPACAQRCQSRAARLTAAAELAMALPVRRRARRVTSTTRRCGPRSSSCAR